MSHWDIRMFSMWAPSLFFLSFTACVLFQTVNVVKGRLVVSSLGLVGSGKVTHRVFLLLVLVFAGLPVAHKVVQRAVLYQGGEDKDETHGDKEIHGGYVGHLRQGLPGNGTEGGHSQHRGDACQ